MPPLKERTPVSELERGPKVTVLRQPSGMDGVSEDGSTRPVRDEMPVALLCESSDYFHNSFYGCSGVPKEDVASIGQDNQFDEENVTLDLSHVDGDAFEAYQTWLKKRVLTVEEDMEFMEWDFDRPMVIYVDLYIFAYKYDIILLQNDAITALAYAAFSSRGFDFNLIRKKYHRISKGSALQLFLLDEAAHGDTLHDWAVDYEMVNYPLLPRKFLLDVLRHQHIDRRRGDIGRRPIFHLCDYHKHVHPEERIGCKRGIVLAGDWEGELAADQVKYGDSKLIEHLRSTADVLEAQRVRGGADG